LPALQPALRGRIRSPARRAPGRRPQVVVVRAPGRRQMAQVPEPDYFLSGSTGMGVGSGAPSRGLAADAVADAIAVATGRPWGLRRAARAWPARRVLALGIERQ